MQGRWQHYMQLTKYRKSRNRQRIQYFLKQKKLPNAGRIKQMELSINPQVAKSLGLKIPSTEELQAKMRFEELPIWP
jgi:hypothetical protein